jgi:multidrug resistance protein MdtO
MATIAQTLPNSNARFAWFSEFLKKELAPYPGRGALVARMVITSILVMILSMTFRLPYGAYGAIYALILSRESLEATANAVRMVIIGFALAGAYILIGMMVALGDPFLRFVWIVTSFVVGFWAMSALSNYAASSRFGYLIAITVTLWDRNISAAQKVENMLWAVGVITLASIITLLVEIVFASFRKSDPLIDGLAERLTCVEELLKGYGSGDPVNESIQTTVARLAMTGTSQLRLNLRHSNFDSQYAAEMGAVVALTGRLVDLAANLPNFTGRVAESDRERVGGVVRRIREIREDLIRGSVPKIHESAAESETPANLPLLVEIERTVALFYAAFTGSESLRVFAPSAAADSGTSGSTFPRVLLDPEHIRFALRGCLAATSCYVIFNALFWPEISTAVTTCFLTALTTIGASRQKQVLRFAGALVGGFVIGMGAQVFILPYIDSIAGFTILFAAAISIGSWFATSSPRLSYFGVQVSVAFCLINLQEFRFQTSLAVARDRVIGVLLGLFMMWLFFDHLWSKPAAVEMKRTFVSALRLLAKLARRSDSTDLQTKIESSYALRESINAHFDRVRSLADGLLFEFGPSRSRDLELRDRIRRWQPQLRTLFVMRIASLKYRLQTPGFEVPEMLRVQLETYDNDSARLLEKMADWIECDEPQSTDRREISDESANRTAERIATEAAAQLPPGRAQSLMSLLRGIDEVTTVLAREVMSGAFVGPRGHPHDTPETSR